MILVMLSGGFDSTALLIKNLQEGKPVIAQHVIIKNAFNKWEAEMIATRSIIKHLQKTYDFKYIETTIIQQEHTTLLDSHACAFEASQTVRAHFYPKEDRVLEVQMGWVKGDRSTGREIRLGLEYGTPGAIFRAATMDLPLEIKLNMPLLHLEKKELLIYNKEVINLIFSCRSPINNKPCNKCESCLLLNELK